MSSILLANFLIFAFINAFTPGPGNILALNTAVNYGIKKGKNLYLGIFTGYFIVQLICTSLVYFLGVYTPDALCILKYVGAAYILWLAIHIMRSKPEIEEGKGNASYFKGLTMQLVNIKIYMFGLTALSGYIMQVRKDFLGMYAYELIIVFIGISATCTWIILGVSLKKIYLKHFKIINIILGILLLECVYSILFL